MISEFITWVVISILIASPLAWLAMQNWAQEFAYHIQIGPWVFLMSGFIAIAIAVITVSWQTVRAARRNPIEALRYE